MYYCGIDIGKYHHEGSVIDESGKALLESLSFSNTKEGCEKLLALFEHLNLTKEELLLGMEATGHYWLSVHAFLLERGYEVKVINPIQSEAFRKMYIRQTKNDSRDSFIIAQIMRFGQFSATNLSEEVIVALRQLSRYRLALVDSCGDCKRRIIALLDQVFPEYDSLFSDTFGTTSKEVLSRYPTPENLLAVSTGKLTKLLEKVSHGRLSREKAEQLKAAAADSFGISFAKDAFAFQIRQLIEQLSFLEEQIKELEEQISLLLKQTGSYITTIPGIGDTLGAIILSEIGDIHRFDAPGKPVAFAGLDVKVAQSGEFTGTRQTISKRGSPYLRRAIWLAASRAAFCDPILSEYYQSLRARRQAPPHCRRRCFPQALQHGLHHPQGGSPLAACPAQPFFLTAFISSGLHGIYSLWFWPRGYFVSIYAEIGETIIYLRKQKGFTQENLALECAISVSYLRLIEHGNANPTINELWRIAEVLEVELRNPFAVSTVIGAPG